MHMQLRNKPGNEISEQASLVLGEALTINTTLTALDVGREEQSGTLEDDTRRAMKSAQQTTILATPRRAHLEKHSKSTRRCKS